jgi:diguanylate cyclase (GGDEF)-like protein
MKAGAGTSIHRRVRNVSAREDKSVVRVGHDYRRLGATLGVALAALLAIVLVATLVATRAPAQFATLSVFATASAILLAALGYVAGGRFEAFVRTALSDATTAIAGRNVFEAELAAAVARARTTAMPLALVVVDVQGLDAIDDVAAAIKRACRTRDTVAHSRDGELAVLMVRTTASEARVAAKRIQASLHELGAPQIVVAIGVADLANAASPDGAALLEAADEALRVAKQMAGAAKDGRGGAATIVAPPRFETRVRSTRPTGSAAGRARPS